VGHRLAGHEADCIVAVDPRQRTTATAVACLTLPRGRANVAP
jgi:hypothetical protein